MAEPAPLQTGKSETIPRRRGPRTVVEIPRGLQEALTRASTNGAGTGLPLFLQPSPDLLQQPGWADFLANPEAFFQGVPAGSEATPEAEDAAEAGPALQTEVLESATPDAENASDQRPGAEGLEQSDLPSASPDGLEIEAQDLEIVPAETVPEDSTNSLADERPAELELALEAELEELESTPPAPESDVETVVEAATLAAELPTAPEADTETQIAPQPSINPDAVVQSWQQSVSQAAQGIPQPILTAGAEAETIQRAGTDRSTRQRDAQEQIPAEAMETIPAVPEDLEPPPPAPATDPIPEHTSRIREIITSRPRLPTQTLPNLQRSPRYGLQDGSSGGNTLPSLGDTPIDPDLFQLIMTPGAVDLSGIEQQEEGSQERQSLQQALDILQAPLNPEPQEGNGEPAPVVDQGPQPIPPLPESQQTPVGQVVARLLANPARATREVVKRLRRMAYPRGVLQQEYPDMDAGLSAQLEPELVAELRQVAEAAGLSGEALNQMVSDHRQTLEQEAQATQDTLQQTGEATTDAVSEAGQETLDTIAGARLSSDEEIIRRQEAASGGTDPEVINARRDVVMRWVRQQVTSQITNYQNAQDRRERELNQGQRQQQNAYTATAQREEYRIINGPAPALPEAVTPTTETAQEQAIQRRRQDLAANVRNWKREQIDAVQADVRRLQREATNTTQSHRTTLETAGDEAIAAARLWAEDRILEGSSWWERLVDQLTRWFGDAQGEVEQWEVDRTRDTRDGIVQDLAYITQLQQQVAQGATQEQLLAQDGLTAEQRDIIEAYFEQPEGRRHPLELAAVGLQQRLAGNHLSQSIPAFERELLAKPDADFEQLNAIGRAMRPGFDAASIAQQVHAAVDQWGTDEAAIYTQLQGLNTIQAAAVRKVYRSHYHSDLDADLRDELSGEELTRAQLQLSGRSATADAVALHDAVAGLGTDEAAIMTLLRGRSQAEIETIRAEYEARYGESLEAALHGDLGEGNEQDQADALLRGDTATADAIALDQAMRDSFFSWGTDEAQIEQTYSRVRSEVQALAEREGWNSEQMEAEIRRRSQAIEAQFNQRYADVEQYQVPGMEGESVLRQAFASEMDPGPERDLANALADSDLAAADAARIEIERRSVYADDDTINGVLRSQYERSLQATRLDQSPARRRAIERQMQAILEANPDITEEELSRRRFQLEHQMERDLADEAQSRSRISMEALQNAYDDRYGRPLSFTLAMNMSGTDLEQARDLLAQGGRLTALQEIDYATRGAGTDEDALRRTLSGMTRDEIADVRRAWEAQHPDESFDAMLRGELSGRDQYDIMDMVEHGAPESASERIAQQRRRTEYELNELTGVFGGLAAGSEESWLRRQMADLEELEPQLHRPLSQMTPEERLQLRDELDMRVTRVEDAIADHRRAIDSVTDTATQVVGLVVGVTVGAALTVISGGALGPVMIAVLASAASTLSTMGTKYLIQGGSYGVEDMGVDLAVGVVDALTAAATAGMGSRLLRGAGGVAQQAARPTQATRLASRFGQSALAQRIGRLPGVQGMRSGLSSLNRLESGLLTRGITGQSFLARIAQSERQSMRLFAELMAEGIENAASAVPSAVVGTALNDQTWQGNAALNLLEGTVMGVGTGLLMGAAMQGGGHLYQGTRRSIRLSTPEGRFLEASHILGDAFQQHRSQHPDATYADFMAHADGVRARAEVDRQGLIPGSALAPEATPPRPRSEGEATTPVRSEAEATPTETPTTARPETEPATRSGPAALRPEAEATPSPDGPTSPRPDAEPRIRPDAEPAPTRPDAERLQPAPDALRHSLPEGMRDTVPLHIDPDLSGRTVQVKPDIDPDTGLVRGVRILAGPDARPIDILMHAPVVQGMQRYSGLLGRVRVLLERAQAWFHLEDAIQVGSPAWEARLELQKLPAILEQRMRQIGEADLSPADRARLLADVEGLSRQIDTHQATLESPEARQGRGRGYVAAEEGPPPLREQDIEAARSFGESLPEYTTSLRQDRESAFQEIAKKRQDRRGAERQKRDLQRRLGTLESQRRELEIRRQRQTDSDPNLEQRLRDLDAEIQTTTRQRDDALETIETLTADIQAASRRHQQASSDLRHALEAEARQQQDQIGLTEKTLQTRQQQQQKLEAALQKLEADAGSNPTLYAIIRQYRDRLDSEPGLIDQLRSHVHQRSEGTALQRSLRLIDQLDTYQQRRRSIRRRQNAVADEISALQQQRGALSSERNVLRREGRDIGDEAPVLDQVRQQEADWEGRRVRMGTDPAYTQPNPAGLPEFEAALATRVSHDAPSPQARHEREIDAALLRRWGDTIRQLHDQLPPELRGPFIDQLQQRLSQLPDQFSGSQYNDFRRWLRGQVLDHVMAQPRDRRLTTLRQFLFEQPGSFGGPLLDSGSIGSFFSEFRVRELQARLAEARQTGGVPGIVQGQPDIAIRPLLEGGEKRPVRLRTASGDLVGQDADGAIHVDGDIHHGPGRGDYLVDDKAGNDPFDLAQAQGYSRVLTDEGRLQTSGPATSGGQHTYAGLVYVFQNPQAAQDAVTLMNAENLHPHLHVAYFNSQGELVFVR